MTTPSTSIPVGGSCPTATLSDFAKRLADLDAASWPAIEPFYRELIDRPLRCEMCLEKLILDRSDLDARVAEAEAELYIAMTCHTDDEAKQKAFLAFVENVEPQRRKVSFELDRKIAESPHVGKLDQERFGVLLRDVRNEVELFREENLALQTDVTRLDQEYSQISGAMTVEFDGATRTMAQMQRYLEETDRSRRESAWRAMMERRYADHDKIDGIFDRMIELRDTIGRNAGFDDFRDYQHRRMARFDYTPDDCARFHDAVEQVCVPVLRRLQEERRAALGIESLRPWDVAVDLKGRDPLRPFDDAERLVDGSSRIFHRMRASLGSMFDELRSGGCLDLDSRPGKAPGGYQYQRQWTRRPFIFMNAAGLHRDLVTMVHEAGHAFHSTLSRHEQLLAYRGSPTEFAEVASMSMELLMLPYVDEFYGDDEADRARRGALEDIVSKLCWIAQIDAFQHWLYTNPKHDRKARTEQWLALSERFGGDVDWSGFEAWQRHVWQRQLHLFGVPFYYIEYGIAQLGALQLWLNAQDDEQAALDRYEKALALGGSRPLPELFAAAGLDFDFGPETVGRLMERVEEQLAALPA